jgi:sugar phosphate isomerase/epimerase
MKILFSTGCLFHLPLEETFRLAADAGFDGCDLVVNRDFNDPRYEETIEKALSTLPIHALHAPFMKVDAWGTHVQALMRCIDLAKRFGISTVNFHPPSWFHMEMKFFKWFRQISDFQKELACEGIFLTIENMPLSGRRLKLAPYVLNRYEDLIEFGSKKNLYFTFDTTHLATFDTDVVSAFLRFFKTGRLKNIHLSDALAPDQHLFFGRGDLPLARLLNTVKVLGYDELVTVELGSGELPRTREWLTRVLSYACSFVRLHLCEDGRG